MIPLPRDSTIRQAIIDKYYHLEDWENQYQLQSAEIKAIIDYSGLSFNEVTNLPLSLFLCLKKDTWIHNHKKTKEGQELLKTLYRLQQTEPDYDAIHRFNIERRGEK